MGGKRPLAHRLMYALLVGPIPGGLELDHTCSNTICVNPGHLDPVTHQENVRRGRVGQWNSRKTHCPSGHPYDEVNTYVNKQGGRHCRICLRVRKRAPRF